MISFRDVIIMKNAFYRHVSLTFFTFWNIIQTMMKSFKVEKIVGNGLSNSHSRFGSWQLSLKGAHEDKIGDASDNGTTEHKVFNTPMYFLHTQTGSIPHVSAEVLELIYPTPPVSADMPNNSQIPPVQISLDATLKFAIPLKKFGKGVGKFVGLPNFPVFLTIHDPLYHLRAGHNDKFGIALWSRHGRSLLTSKEYAEILESFKPSVCQVPSDYDVQPDTSGVKRLKKSLTRAENNTLFLLKEKCVTGAFITIEASWFQMDEGLAKKTVANLLESQHQIEGVILAGLVNRFKSPEVKSQPKTEKRSSDAEKLNVCANVNLELVNKMVSVFPSNLPKYISGSFTLPVIVDLVMGGVDVFDSSVCSRMADDAEAFVLDEVMDVIFPGKLVSERANESLTERTIPDKSTNSSAEKIVGGVITLKDKQYFDDFGPISITCKCYTCRQHTRSYIHHLYATNELLGPVLVQIHNLTALDAFFQIIRHVLQKDENLENLNRIKKLLSVN